MINEEKRIDSSCSYFVCRVCRTKTGRSHQAWCTAADSIMPDCSGCIYGAKSRERCLHPALKRKGQTGK